MTTRKYFTKRELAQAYAMGVYDCKLYEFKEWLSRIEKNKGDKK